MSRIAAGALLQEEQTLARELLSRVGESPEDPVVSSVMSADGSKMTVAVLKPSRSPDALQLSTGDTGNVSVPQAVLQQLGGGLVALTAGPLSAEMTKLLSAAGARESEHETDLAAMPLSLSLFDSSGNPLEKQLAEPIVLTLNGDDDGHVVCVFWDPKALKWSQEGVSLVSSDASGSISCQTTHLSIFAAMRSDLDIPGAFDCKTQTFAFSFALLGQNSSWWRQGPATALWAGLVLSLVAAALAASQDARSDLSSWSRELLLEQPDPTLHAEEKKGDARLQKPSSPEPTLERVMTYCFRCLQAFRVGVDVDTLGLSLFLAQDLTDRDPTPLRRAALDLAEQRDLFASATRAVCSFTGAGLTARFLLLFPAMHPGTGLLASSLFYPRLSIVALFSAKLIGPMALNVFMLQALGVAFRSEEGASCEVREALVKPLCAAVMSCLLGQFVSIGLRRLQHFDWSKEAELPYEEWMRVHEWRRRVRMFWIASILYLSLSALCIAGFLSSVSQGDGTYWLYGALVNAIFQLMLLPLLNAFTLALLSTVSAPRYYGGGKAVGKSCEFPSEESFSPDPELAEGPRPKAAEFTTWGTAPSEKQFLSGCMLEDYFTVTESASAPDASRLGSLDLSPLRGHDKDGIAFNEKLGVIGILLFVLHVYVSALSYCVSTWLSQGRS